MGAAASAELGVSGPSSDEIEAVLQRKEMAAMAGIVQLSPSELLFDACWRGNPAKPDSKSPRGPMMIGATRTWEVGLL